MVRWADVFIDNLLDLPQVRHFRPFSAIAAGASRIIYYDARGLFWQCREGTRQGRVQAYLIRANDRVVTQRRIFDSYPDDVLNIFSMWEDFVREFTSRTLSHESDRLYAIAGLWRAVLFRQLQQYCDVSHATPVPAYGAPTWSCASMTGCAVAYNDNTDSSSRQRKEGENYSTPVPRLQESKVRPRDSRNHLGDVSAARLTLLVQVRDFPCHMEEDTDGETTSIQLDEAGASLHPWLKLIRLADDFCLIVARWGENAGPSNI